MAEALVRVVDKTNADSAALDRLCFKAGDVLHVAPDGWAWGTDELTNPDWRVVQLPGVDPASLADMVDPERDAQGNVLRKRRRLFNLTSNFARQAIASGQVILFEGPNVAKFLALREDKPAAGPIVLG